jgi:hypothetical protein
MDGVEVTKSKGMVIGGLKFIDPQINRQIMKDLLKIEKVKVEGSEQMSENSKRRRKQTLETSSAISEAIQAQRQEEEEQLMADDETRGNSSFSSVQPSNRSTSNKNRAGRRGKKDRVGADEQVSFQSVLATLLVRIKMGKDSLDVNYR